MQWDTPSASGIWVQPFADPLPVTGMIRRRHAGSPLVVLGQDRQVGPDPARRRLRRGLLRATVIIRYSLTCTALSTAFSPVRVRKRRPIRRLTWALERVKESPQAAGEWAYCSGAGRSQSTRVRKVAWAQEEMQRSQVFDGRAGRRSSSG